MNCIKRKEWCNNVGISVEPSAPDSYAQNEGAKRFGQVIMEKACAMRLSANLPHKLWREIVATVTYFYNWTSRASNNWMSPYKVFHTYVFKKKKVSGPYKPRLHHSRAYGCKEIYSLSQKVMHNTGINVQNLMLKLILAFLLAMSQLLSIEYKYPSTRK